MFLSCFSSGVLSGQCLWLSITTVHMHVSPSVTSCCVSSEASVGHLTRARGRVNKRTWWVCEQCFLISASYHLKFHLNLNDIIVNSLICLDLVLFTTLCHVKLNLCQFYTIMKESTTLFMVCDHLHVSVYWNAGIEFKDCDHRSERSSGALLVGEKINPTTNSSFLSKPQ